MYDAISLPLLAQLTYTSLETSTGGGWQVKEQRGRITDEDLKAVLGRIPTRLPAPEAGRFVTADEVSAWPRRLTHQILGSGAGRDLPLLVHSVSAGQDRSGRSGNVFTHCALPQPGYETYPIQAWRSSSWLTPYGLDAVQSAALGGDGLELSLMLADEVAVFLAEDENAKLKILAILLDAVHASLLNEGPTVALLVRDTEEAAGWIKAVSLCMSGRTSARFVFSTCEVASASGSWAAEEFDLVCLLPESLESVSKVDDIVVLDASSHVDLGVRDADPHRTARGDEVKVTMWSELMFEVVTTYVDLREFCSAMAQLERHIPGEDSSDPSWWMAMVVHSRGESDQTQQVLDIVARLAPSGVADDDTIMELVRGALQSTMGSTTDERFSKLLAMIDSGLTPYMQRLATAAYAESACGDADWLASAQEVRPPAIDRVPLTQEMLATVERLPSTDYLSVTQKAVAGVRFLELTRSLGWSERRDIASARETLKGQWVMPALSDGEVFTQVLGRVAPMQPETLVALRELAFELAGRMKLDVNVLLGLELLNPRGDFDRCCSESDGAISALGMQVLQETWRRTRTVDDRKPLVSSIVWAASQAVATSASDVKEWRAMEGNATLEPHELVPIVHKRGRSVSPEVIAMSLLSARVDAPELDTLLATIIDQAASTEEVIDLARGLQLLRSGKWQRPQSLRTAWPTIRNVFRSADERNISVSPEYRQAMKLMAVCALVGWPDMLPAPEELNRLDATQVPDEQIEKALPLFDGALGANPDRISAMFPFMVRQEYLAPDPSRARLLRMQDPATKLSEVERLIRAWFEHQKATVEQVESEAKPWNEKMAGSRAIQDARAAKDIEKSMISWFKKNVRQRSGLGTRLWKGLTK